MNARSKSLAHPPAVVGHSNEQERQGYRSALQASGAQYLDRNSGMVFPGSAGVSPAQKAARLAALPGYKLSERHGSNMMSGYLAGAQGLLPRFFSLILRGVPHIVSRRCGFSWAGDVVTSGCVLPSWCRRSPGKLPSWPEIRPYTQTCRYTLLQRGNLTDATTPAPCRLGPCARRAVPPQGPRDTGSYRASTAS
jgi:hypothetical protein